jgi:hypothetical protein
MGAMVSKESVDKLLDHDEITRDMAQTMLAIYVADINWLPHIELLYKRLIKKMGPEKAQEEIRETIAFTTLIRAYNSTVRLEKDHPESLLFWAKSFHQLNERDWLTEYKKVVSKDMEIKGHRQEIIKMGIFEPIDFQPFCRQAYNWLCDRAASNDVKLDVETKKKFRNLVRIYGGTIISNIFSKHGKKMDKFPNWNSSYFVERLIFDTYSIDEIKKIKSKELTKTNAGFIQEAN